jgi:hypothetical protein
MSPCTFDPIELCRTPPSPEDGRTARSSSGDRNSRNTLLASVPNGVATAEFREFSIGTSDVLIHLR